MRGMSFKAMAQRQGPIASTAASLMKLGITEMMFDVAMLRGDVAGADAMLDGPEAAGMLAAPGGRIAGGTSQVQRNIIGERLLGLPREPKPPRVALRQACAVFSDGCAARWARSSSLNRSAAVSGIQWPIPSSTTNRYGPVTCCSVAYAPSGPMAGSWSDHT